MFRLLAIAVLTAAVAFAQSSPPGCGACPRMTGPGPQAAAQDHSQHSAAGPARMTCPNCANGKCPMGSHCPMTQSQVLPTEFPSPSNPLTAAKVALGRMLFYEPRLSRSQTVSCNSCHALDKYGVDGAPVSTGHSGQKGSRNAPTVYNAAGHFAQFWDGRATTVEEQAKGPMLNPVEMAMPSEGFAVGVLKSIPEYLDAFRLAFPDQVDPVTFDNAALAIGAFERRLVTPSRFDRYLAGDKVALTAAETHGYMVFRQIGCASCHNGATLGGQSFQKLGARLPWKNQSDLGRYQVTRSADDKQVFKVPSLRNVEKTAPYFHDGTVATLPQAVRLMGRHQLDMSLRPGQVNAIVAFLNSLTGELPLDYVREPRLPGKPSS